MNVAFEFWESIYSATSTFVYGLSMFQVISLIPIATIGFILETLAIRAAIRFYRWTLRDEEED